MQINSKNNKYEESIFNSLFMVYDDDNIENGPSNWELVKIIDINKIYYVIAEYTYLRTSFFKDNYVNPLSEITFLKQFRYDKVESYNFVLKSSFNYDSILTINLIFNDNFKILMQLDCKNNLYKIYYESIITNSNYNYEDKILSIENNNNNDAGLIYKGNKVDLLSVREYLITKDYYNIKILNNLNNFKFTINDNILYNNNLLDEIKAYITKENLKLDESLVFYLNNNNTILVKFSIGIINIKKIEIRNIVIKAKVDNQSPLYSNNIDSNNYIYNNLNNDIINNTNNDNKKEIKLITTDIEEKNYNLFDNCLKAMNSLTDLRNNLINKNIIYTDICNNIAKFIKNELSEWNTSINYDNIYPFKESINNFKNSLNKNCTIKLKKLNNPYFNICNIISNIIDKLHIQEINSIQNKNLNSNNYIKFINNDNDIVDNNAAISNKLKKPNVFEIVSKCFDSNKNYIKDIDNQDKLCVNNFLYKKLINLFKENNRRSNNRCIEEYCSMCCSTDNYDNKACIICES